MRKASIKHENLKRIIGQIESMRENTPDECFERLLNELKHSSLIVAGDISGDIINVMTAKTNHGDFGMLFTDMDEYRKVFPDFEVEAHENSFIAYLDMLTRSNLKGYILNVEGEGMILPRDLLNLIEDVPTHLYPTEGSYTSAELKDIKDSINNESLEHFIQNPDNIGKYEELFERVSTSTMLTLMLSRQNLEGMAEDGVISTMGGEPVGFIYIDKVGGEFATAYTSEEKISKIRTPYNKYSQIVNISQLADFVLNYDMDGIIINPGEENVMLTREVLLEFSSYLKKTCNDKRLNSAIYNMFLMDGEVYV